MKIYIAGPMTGIKELNYPAFNQVAKELRANNHTVYNPAEIIPPAPDFAKSLGKRGLWIWYMKKAIGKMLKADAVILLPNWKTSAGAMIEKWLAEALDYEVYELKDFPLTY